MKASLLCLVAIACGAVAGAAELPRDARLGPLKDLDGYFPFTPPELRVHWEERAERVRRQIRVSQGLWPEPTRTPLNAVIHGRIEGDDYTVEKVFFESMPGLFVTGNLYRPKDAAAGVKRPAILCPHGHWEEARFRVLNDAELKKELETGGERLAVGGRSRFQSLGVQLARMGCIALVYDMPGYCDSKQLSFELVHKFAKQRPEMNAAENWGLFSPQAELHAQSVMGLMTWNSIRALDFVTSLPDVDPARIGCTGGSGGGTQTMILAGIDPRVAVECPAVMVSTAMQGGCTCENASLLRIGTGNVEFAALFAPKPLGMTAADDWTKEMPTKGFPELQRHWELRGAPDKVALWPLLHFPHNFNAPSREKIYGWFNRHLGLGLDESKLLEREYRLLTRDELTVWNSEHPAPPGGPDFERKLLRWWHDDAQAKLAKAAKSADEIQRVFRGAWEIILGRRFDEAGQVTWERRGDPVSIDALADEAGKQVAGYLKEPGALRNSAHGEELPGILLRPREMRSERRGVVTVSPPSPFIIWLDEQGKSGLFEGTAIRAEVRRLLDAGNTVLGVDLLFQGDFLADGKAVSSTRRVKNPREAAAYTFGYNHALFAQRVHDVLTAIRLARGKEGQERAVGVVGLGRMGPIAAAARALADGEVARAVVDTNDFRFANVSDIHDVNFLPGAAKYGDLDGLLALGVRGHVFILHGEAGLGEFVRESYRLAGAANRLNHAARSPDSRRAALEWLAAIDATESRLIAP